MSAGACPEPPFEVDNAWVVCFRGSDYVLVAGPLPTSALAHAVQAHLGGIVVFNCETEMEAIGTANEAVEERARLHSNVNRKERRWQGCLN
jgi:hypothetical protein